MSIRTTLSILAILSLATATGCDIRGGTNGDDDDDASGLGGLDANGDGVLTDDDLQTGTSGLYTTTSDGDGETEAGETFTNAWLGSGDGAWSLNANSNGSIPMSLAMWFVDPGPDDWELSVGSGDVNYVSASSELYLLWADSVDGSMEITDVTGDNASGYFDGSVTLIVADQFESPTGQTVTIEGFAFNELSMGLDAQ